MVVDNRRAVEWCARNRHRLREKRARRRLQQASQQSRSISRYVCHAEGIIADKNKVARRRGHGERLLWLDEVVRAIAIVFVVQPVEKRLSVVLHSPAAATMHMARNNKEYPNGVFG